LDDDSNKMANNNGLPHAIYSIKSVVHHIGHTASSGHYTADSLRDENTWVNFDDGVTHEITLDDIVKSPPKQRSAYMIMYSLD
jgi:ubiquitin C-terminal hydrolase